MGGAVTQPPAAVTATSRVVTLLGTWGRPIDSPALWALILAGVLAAVACVPATTRVALGFPPLLPRRVDIRRRIVLVFAFAAAFLSLGYVAHYLRAGPRIIDATSYFLEGRVLSHGHLSWPVGSPSGSFRGRFLLLHDGHLSVIFPPGYPLLLALGFFLRAPLVVGPVLGGALVVATYGLARELAHDHPVEERQAVATLAAGLSVVCAALRYHTADTMAHGASALGVTSALGFAFYGLRSGRRAPWLVAGLALGWVACTRPVSSFAIGAVLLYLAAARRARVVPLLLGVVPGVAFLILASHAQTGRWLTSPQLAYYADSDGPPGCFRYGFGAGVGCLHEHKDFVLSRLPDGYGLVPALLTTFRRLRVHLLDVANLEPLALLVLVPLWRARASRQGRLARLTLAVVAGQIIAYAPFYFDGDYPGGGARFFADVLPIEHALVAVAVSLSFPSVPFFRRALGVVALALFGFAIHGAFEHDALAKRDGGKPLYDLEDTHSLTKGILFFDTDHGFNLAFDPFAEPKKAIVAARLRGDDHDRLLVERLDHAQAHVYKQDPPRPVLTPWVARPGSSHDLWRFEAEVEWPPLTQGGGWAEPVWASTSCASEGRVLTLHAGQDGEAHATLDVPVPRTGKWSVQPRALARGGPGHGRLQLIPKGRAPLPADAALVWEWKDSERGATAEHDVCMDLAIAPTGPGVDLDFAGAEWLFTATGGDVSLDATMLRNVR